MRTMVKFKLFGLITLIVAAMACKKDKDTVFSVATLNVVNASTGIDNAQVITPNVTGYHSLITGINYRSSAVYTIPAPDCSVSFYTIADTTKPFYASTVSASAGDIYSVFIGGNGGEDVVMNKDNIPYYSDSTLGVRFINMTTNSQPVNVTLSGSTDNEFSNVSYKSITDFKTYSGKSTDPASYKFQVTDGSGNVLAISPALSRTTVLLHHNVTLVFTGLIDGTGNSTPAIFTVNNY